VPVCRQVSHRDEQVESGPRRVEFSTADVLLAREFLDRNFGGRLLLTGSRDADTTFAVARVAVGQTLYVTEGRGLVQARDGGISEIRAGDIVVTPAGQWHWHGAAPEHYMTHLSITEAPYDDLPAGPTGGWRAWPTTAATATRAR
jgi:Cupin domain